MNTPVTIVNEDDTLKPGAAYVGTRDNGMILLAVKDAEHLDAAAVLIYPENALRLGMKLIATAYNEDRDSGW